MDDSAAGAGASVNNLAVLRSAQGDDTQAAALYVRALAIFEAELGTDHPTVVICRKNYARLICSGP